MADSGSQVHQSSVQRPLAGRVSVVATVGAVRVTGGLITFAQVVKRRRHTDQQELALAPGIGPRRPGRQSGALKVMELGLDSSGPRRLR